MKIDVKNILVPIDGSQPSFEVAKYALKLAKLNNAKVTLLHVMTVPPFPKYSKSIKIYEEEVEREANEWFNEIKNFEEAKGVEIDQRVYTMVLSIVEGIIHVADEGNFDLIVISPRGKSTLKRLLLGSVTSGVVTHATCSVLVVR